MNSIIKILHLEDFPEDAELIAHELQRGDIQFDKKVVDNKEDYEKILVDFIPDIILSDHSLPSFNSFQALAILKEKELDIPFILVTATMSEEFAVDIMKQGAADYILKDRLQRLPSAIINSIKKRRLEQEQRAAIERLSVHIENTPLGFIEWNEKAIVKSWSTRAQEIFGWSQMEVAEIQEDTSGSRENLSWVNEILGQLISGEAERNMVQYRSATKEGKMIWCQWFNSVLKDKDGKVETIMSLVQDITEQKQIQWQKDNFLSIVSHELNTPLTTISAYGQLAEIMLEEKGDVETLGTIKRMRSQVDKLAILVQHLLDFTKTKTGKLIYNEEFFDFTELMKEVVHDMQKINSTHKIKNGLAKPVTLYGDKNKIGQVINNLISNAIKFSPKAASIVVDTLVQKDGIEFTVQDFGMGISTQHREEVFAQFYRVNQDSQSSFPGMGIGLYISSQIVARHGGKIWVESIIDKGSTFYTWLPFDYRLDMKKK